MKEINPNNLFKNKRLVKILNNISWLFFDKFIRIFLGIIVISLVAKYLGPKQYGLLNYSIAFVGLFGSVATLGLKDIVVREIVNNPKKINEIMGSALTLQCCAGLIVYLITLLVAYFMLSEKTFTFIAIAILGLQILFSFRNSIEALFESQVETKYLVWIQNTIYFIFSFIQIMFVFKKVQLIFFIWAIVLEIFIVSILFFLSIKKIYSNITEFKFSFIISKKLIKFSWPLFLSTIMIMIYMKIDQIMLGTILNKETVGIYSAAVRISEVWFFIPIIILSSVFPSLLETKKKNSNLYNQRLQKIFDLMFIFGIFLVLITSFFSDIIIELIFGEMYKSSGLILKIHIWSSIFVFWGMASSRYFISENLQIYSLVRTLIGAVINILLNLYLIPRFGGPGAAVASLISFSTAGFFIDFFQKQTRMIFLMKLKSINLFGAFSRIIDK